MGKCTIIGKIRAPANVGQAVRINGKKCDEETVWNIAEVYGGESVVTDFNIENKSNVLFSVSFELSTPSEGEYTCGVYLSDGVTPVTSPIAIDGKELKNLKLKLAFDKYITESTYEIIVEFDFV